MPAPCVHGQTGPKTNISYSFGLTFLLLGVGGGGEGGRGVIGSSYISNKYSVSLLGSWICNFYLSVAARKTV